MRSVAPFITVAIDCMEHKQRIRQISIKGPTSIKKATKGLSVISCSGYSARNRKKAAKRSSALSSDRPAYEDTDFVKETTILPLMFLLSHLTIRGQST